MDIEMHEVKEASDEVALFDEESSAQVKRKEPAMTRRRVLIYAGVLILAIAVLAGVLVAGVALGRNWDKVFRTSCSFSPSFQTLFAAERFHLDPRATKRSFQIQNEIHEMLHWPAVLESAHYASKIQAASGDDVYFSQCMNDTHWLRPFADTHCTHSWHRKLRWNEPVAVKNVLAVITEEDLARGDVVAEKDHQNGGVAMILEDGTKAYFKPCWGNAATMESYLNEIAVYHLDRILGMYRIPTVVPREFSSDLLLKLAEERVSAEDDPEEKARWAMETMIEHCGTEDGSAILGGVVGWSPIDLRLVQQDALSNHLFRFEEMSPEDVTDLMDGDFKISNDSPPEKRVKPLESVLLYVFDSLIGYQRRTNHNMFIGTSGNSTGPFIYIDNDRAQWEYSKAYDDPDSMHLNCEIAEQTLGTLCKFPRSLATRILLLSPNATEAAVEMFGDEMPRNTSLGKMLFNSTNIYGDMEFQKVMFSCEDAVVLDKNMQFWATVINQCIDRHGEEFVLIDEPWKRTFDFYEQTAPSWGRSLNDVVTSIPDTEVDKIGI